MSTFIETALLEDQACETPREVKTDYRRATVLAFVLCGLLTTVSALVPPAMYADSGWGMLEWRALTGGGPANSMVSPDPADLAHDRAVPVRYWTPGQYLVPGIFTLPGLRIGPALALTAGLSLLCCLLGWIRVAKHFEMSPVSATLMVALMSTFRYSTLPFGIYNGGEILLQGITPWLILAGCRVPVASALQAVLLAGCAVLTGFFVKLTGVLVAGAALAAGTVAAFVRLRRITPGMLAGAAGAILAAASLYVAWAPGGKTPGSGTDWSFQPRLIAFALAAPWGAGVSWMDTLDFVLFNPHRPVLTERSQVVWFLLPAVLFFPTAILWGRRQTAGRPTLNSLIAVTAGFYAVCALAMLALYSHGSDISIEERHFRSAGMLIFVCALAVADSLPRKAVRRVTVLAVCGLMSLYGCASFTARAWSTRSGEIDRYSRTHQVIVDVVAIEFARAAFAREGRDALFVLPSPDVAVAFPPGARILSTQLDFESEELVATRRYAGRVPGNVYILIQTRILQTRKGALFLQAFADYPRDSWGLRQFGGTSVLFQKASESPVTQTLD